MKTRTFVIILILVLAVMLINSCATKRFIRTAESGDFQAVKELIDKGVDVNVSDRYGSTALWKASQYGHTEVVKLLIDAGADVNAEAWGRTSLLLALG